MAITQHQFSSLCTLLTLVYIIGRKSAMNKAPLPLPAYLKRERISQVEFARRINVAPNTVHRWCVGSLKPGWGAMSRIVEATAGEVTADSFLSGHRLRAA
jgi:hypothetical protein